MLYPLPAVSDTSKQAGAIAVILPVKPLPETVNCWILGLADAVPAQAAIVPVAVVAVMVGGVGVGFTVMVNWVGIPEQPEALIKFPNE